MRAVMLLLIAATFACSFSEALAADGDGLLKVVVLSRHGLRAPTQDAKILELWSQRPWPEWPVPRGDLTPRGARLVEEMWADLKAVFHRDGLLPEGMCPQPGAVHVRADVDERTRATAAALLEGLAPDCGLGYAVAQGVVDPLFHPIKAGLGRYDAVAVATNVLAQAPGGLERLKDEFSGALDLLGSISGPPASALCARFALMPRCQISDLPNAISVAADGSAIRLVGGLGIASSMAEIFLLEYGEWPGVAAGWGEVDGQVLSQILPVHSRIFDVINRAPVVAWSNGSALLSEMAAALLGAHYDKSLNEAKLVVFVGHDTNIANVAGLLNFNWQASGYPPNGIPPAGALFLELWQKNGRQEVVARFFSQTPKSLHAAFQERRAAEFAPRAAVITEGESGAVVAMAPREFAALAASVTEGAPKAPGQHLQMAFGMPAPDGEPEAPPSAH